MGLEIPLTVDDWLKTTDTIDPMHNTAVVNAVLSRAMARALNNQKISVEDIANHINKLSELNVRINLFKNTDTSPAATKKLGDNAADAKNIIDLLLKEGVKVDAQIVTDVNAGKQPSVTNDTISGWGLAINGITEKLNNTTQQESLRLQTFTNRYTQAGENSTSVQQKDGQSKGTIISNYRGSGG